MKRIPPIQEISTDILEHNFELQEVPQDADSIRFGVEPEYYLGNSKIVIKK